ncbi:hypothetical protein F4803DRAFT_548221 [Xylaria telfairii]|nr:hypothetical protein F4803DRAFT_548221 [Xylaria telfairii]
MPSNTTIVTRLPEELPEQDVINRLQNHDTYIRTTSPDLVSQKHISGIQELNHPCMYEIVDIRGFGRIKFGLTLTNVVDGVNAVVEGRAPTGSLKIRSEWRARAGKLEEVVEIESNFITKAIVKKNVDKEHLEFHRRFVATTQ